MPSRHCSRTASRHNSNVIVCDSTDGNCKSRLKLVHTTPVMASGFPFRSNDDLVQMTTSQVGTSSINSMTMQSQADTNADGVVNQVDWETFVGDRLSDEAAADLNFNSEIDPEDAGLFVEASINGT